MSFVSGSGAIYQCTAIINLYLLLKVMETSKDKIANKAALWHKQLHEHRCPVHKNIACYKLA